MEDKWHHLNVEAIEQKLNSKIESGLSQAEANERLTEHGRNELPEKKKESKIKKIPQSLQRCTHLHSSWCSRHYVSVRALHRHKRYFARDDY